MIDLMFEGVVSRGRGEHSTLVVPGRGALSGAPADWPEQLYPGSLNVRVIRYPPQLAEHGLLNAVSTFDQGHFVPEIEIPQAQFGNNRLAPTAREPRRGNGQAWRARLEVPCEGLVVNCWLLRRIGSAVGEQLEFVADRRLRDLGLVEGTHVRASVLGSWRDA